MRKINWKLGNKNIKDKTWEEIEREKYDNNPMKQAVYAPMPPLDQISIKPMNYWVARTNFIITNKIACQLSQTIGIEFFRPISPYSFVVSVNEDFFNAHKVIVNINKKLGAKSSRCN